MNINVTQREKRTTRNHNKPRTGPCAPEELASIFS